MLDKFKDIEEIIDKLDNITLDDWKKKKSETQEQFEKRIQEIEDDVEEQLIDVISDSLLNEQEINEEEAEKEAREKINKEYEIYKDAFKLDDSGKLILKDK